MTVTVRIGTFFRKHRPAHHDARTRRPPGDIEGKTSPDSSLLAAQTGELFGGVEILVPNEKQVPLPATIDRHDSACATLAEYVVGTWCEAYASQLSPKTWMHYRHC